MRTPSDSEQIPARLEQLSTQWSDLFDAHGPDRTQAQRARTELLQRYRGAVFRYLLGAARDLDVAEELSQEFAVTFLEGRLHQAEPERGRFRDYVRTILINLVRRHGRTRSQWPRDLSSDYAAPGADSDSADDDVWNAEFVREWRAETLNLTWEALRRERPAYHDLLRLRVDLPDATSGELAERYARQHSKPMTSANVRKILERAHEKFAELLVGEVAAVLETGEVAEVRANLVEMDLLKYCRSALERWSPTGTR